MSVPSFPNREAPDPVVAVGLGVVFDEQRERVLICRRKAGTVLEGYWELPGGKCQKGEAAAACVVREVREEVGIEVEVLRELTVIEHEYPHARVRLHPFVCGHVGGEVRELEVAETRWVKPAEVWRFQFPAANAGVMAAVEKGFAALMDLPDTRG